MVELDPAEIELDGNTPKWDSGWGYLILLDNIIRLACGYLVNNDDDAYYRSLEAWYISAIHWIRKSSSISKEDLEKLVRQRKAAESGQNQALRKYHELLEDYTSKAGLRLKSGSSLPGVLQK